MIEKCPGNRFYESFFHFQVKAKYFKISATFFIIVKHFSIICKKTFWSLRIEDISNEVPLGIPAFEMQHFKLSQKDVFSLKSLKFQGLFFSFKMQFGIKLFIYRHQKVVLNLAFAQHLKSISWNLKTKGVRNA